MNIVKISKDIKEGHVTLGIELGSTQIKSVLITKDFKVIASGTYIWENDFINGIWTYSLKNVWLGIRESYKQLVANVYSRFHIGVKKIDNIGVSAMMHGYLAFDKKGKQLVPFRTWRNNITNEAASKLTKLFSFNVPLRWSIAHLYRSILNKEKHVSKVDFITTLAGYVTWQLSGRKVIGVGDASGMFPIGKDAKFDKKDLDKFQNLKDVKKYPWKIKDILPEVLIAGQRAGNLTSEGAKRLDPSGDLQSGSIIAPPEGDAGTGMVSTNSVRVRTGNISIGTSAFSMIVMDKPLKKVHRDIDVVATPDGNPCAMVHTSNCSSDIDAWARIFKSFAGRIGENVSDNNIYENLFIII